MNGHFAGGRFDVKPTDKFADIKQCLLSEGGATKRVGLLDNVKALRFSWAEFEGLVTSQTISGKRMYVGEADRPNNLLWFLSMNGPSLSKDLAQRTVFIKLKRPKHSGMWRADTEDFIAQNRTALIADCIAFLRGPRKPLAKYSRWASWERDILERLPDPAAAQALILERQNVSDVEEEEAGIVEDYFASQLRRYRYDPDQDVVFIPSAVLCDWYCRATNEKKSATQVTRTMNQAIGEGTVHRLFPSSRKDWGRGLMWRGVNSTPKTGASGDLESRMSSNDSY
jgi:hypothetical protein